MALLTLGPIVGHTTHSTTRIWIAAADSNGYRVELEGGPRAPFISTEPDAAEFGTAMAEATDLAPDTRYPYVVRASD
jgi:hypothetical protein